MRSRVILGVKFIDEDTADMTLYVTRLEHDAVRAQLRDALAEVDRLRLVLEEQGEHQNRGHDGPCARDDVDDGHA